jgi:hypothetical protein
VPSQHIVAARTFNGQDYETQETTEQAPWSGGKNFSPHLLLVQRITSSQVTLSLPHRFDAVPVPYEEFVELQRHDPLLLEAKLADKAVVLLGVNAPFARKRFAPLVEGIVRSTGRSVWGTVARTEFAQDPKGRRLLKMFPDPGSSEDLWFETKPTDLEDKAAPPHPVITWSSPASRGPEAEDGEQGLDPDAMEVVDDAPGTESQSEELASEPDESQSEELGSVSEDSAYDPEVAYELLLSDIYGSDSQQPSHALEVLRWLDELRASDPVGDLREKEFDLDAVVNRVLMRPNTSLATPAEMAQFVALARRAMAGQAAGTGWQGGLARLAAFHLSEQGVFDDKYLISSGSGATMSYGRNWTLKGLDPQLDVTKLQPVGVGPDGTWTEGPVLDFTWGSGVLPYVLVAEPGENHGPLVPLRGVPRQVPWDVAAELIAMDPLLSRMDARAPQGEQVRMVFAWSRSGAGYLDVPRRVASRGNRFVYATTGELEVGSVLRNVVRPGAPTSRWLPVGPGLEPQRYPDEPEWIRNALTHTVQRGRIGRAALPDAEYAGVRENTYEALPRTQTDVVLYINPATGEVTEYEPLAVEWAYTLFVHGIPGRTFFPQKDGRVARVGPYAVGQFLKRRPSLQHLAKEVTPESDGGPVMIASCWGGGDGDENEAPHDGAWSLFVVDWVGSAGDEDNVPHDGARSLFVADPLAEVSTVQGGSYPTRRMTGGYTRVSGHRRTNEGDRDRIVSDVESKEPLVLRMARPEPLPEELDDVAVRAGLVPADVVASLSSRDRRGVRGRALRLVRALRWMFGTDVDREKDFGDLLRGMGVIERMRQADDRLREFPLTLDLLDAVARALPDSPVGDSGVLEGGDAQLIGLKPKYPDEAPEQYRAYEERQKALADRKPVMRKVLDWARSQGDAGPLPALTDNPDLDKGLKSVRDLGARIRGNPQYVAEVLRLPDGAVVGEAERSAALWALVPAYRWFKALTGGDRGDAAARILHRPELRGAAHLDGPTTEELWQTVAQAVAAGRDLRSRTELAAFHLVALGAYDEKTEVREAGSGEATGRWYIKRAERLESFVSHSSMDAVRAADGGEHLTEVRAEWHQDGKMSPHVLVLEEMAPDKVVLSLPGRAGIVVPHEEIAELQVHDPLLRYVKLKAKDVLLVAASSPARSEPLRPLVTSIVRSAGRPVWSTTAHTELSRTDPGTHMLTVYSAGRSPADIWSRVMPTDLVGNASSVATGGQVVTFGPGSGSRSSVGQAVHTFSPSSGSGGDYQDLLAELYQSGVAGVPSDVVVVLRWLDGLRMAEVDEALRRGPFDLDALARRVLLPFHGVPDDAPVGPQLRVQFIALARRAMVGQQPAAGTGWQGGLARLAAFHLSEQGVFDDKYLIRAPSGQGEAYGRNWSPRNLDPQLDVTKFQPVLVQPDGTRNEGPLVDLTWDSPGVLPYVLVAEPGDNQGPLVPFGGLLHQVLWDVAAELIAMDPLLGRMDARAPQGERVRMLFAWSGSGAGYLDVPRRVASRAKRFVDTVTGELEVDSVLRTLIRPDRPPNQWLPVGPGLEPKRYPDDQEWIRNAINHTVVRGRIGRAALRDAEYANLRENEIASLPRKQSDVVFYVNPATGEVVEYVGLDVEWDYTLHLHGLPRQADFPQKDGRVARVSPEGVGQFLKRRPSVQHLVKETTKESDGGRMLVGGCFAGSGDGEGDASHDGARPLFVWVGIDDAEKDIAHVGTRSPFVADPLAEVSMAQGVANPTRRMTDGYMRPRAETKRSDFAYSDVEWKEPLLLGMARPEPLPEELDDVAVRAGLVPADVVASLPSRDRDDVRGRALRLVRALRWMFGTDVDREQDFGDLLRGVGVIERMRQADDRLREFPLTLDLLDAVVRALPYSPVADSGVLEGGDAQLVGLKPKYPDKAPEQYRAYEERQKALEDRKPVMRGALRWARLQEAAGPLRALGDHPDLDEGLRWVRDLGASLRGNPKLVAEVLRLADGVVVGEAERSAALWALVPAYRWFEALTGRQRGDAAARILHRPDLKGTADLDEATGWELGVAVAQAVAAGRDLRNLTELAAFHLVALGAYDKETEVRDAGSGEATGRRYARRAQQFESFVPHSSLDVVRAADGREHLTEKPAVWHQDGKSSPHVLVLEEMAPDKVVLSLPRRVGIVVPHEEIAELQVHDPLLRHTELKAKDILLVAVHSPARPGPLRPLVTSIVRSSGRPVWSTTAEAVLRLSRQRFMVAVFPEGRSSGDVWSRVVPKDLVGNASSVATGGQVVSFGRGAGSRSSAGGQVQAFGPSYGDGSSSDSGGEYQGLLAELYQSGVAGVPSDAVVVLRWLDGLRMAEVDDALRRGPFDLDALARRVLLPFHGVPDDAPVGPQLRVQFIQLARRAMVGQQPAAGTGWQGGLARLAAFHLSEQGVFDDEYLIRSRSGATASYGRNWTLRNLDPQLDVTTVQRVEVRPDGTRTEGLAVDFDWGSPGVLPYVLVAEPGDNRGPLVPLGGLLHQVLWDVAAELIAMDPLVHEMDARAPQGERVQMLFAWSRSGAGYLDVPRRAAHRGNRSVYVTNSELEVGSVLWAVIRPGALKNLWWPVGPGLEPQRYPDEPEWIRNAATHTVLSDRIGRVAMSEEEYAGLADEIGALPATQTVSVIYMNPATGERVEYERLAVRWAYTLYVHGVLHWTYFPQENGREVQADPDALAQFLERRPSMQNLVEEVTQESDGDRMLISGCWVGSAGSAVGVRHEGARSPFVANPLAMVSRVQRSAHRNRRMTDGMARMSGTESINRVVVSDLVYSDVEWKEPLVLRMARPEPLAGELDDVAVRAGLVPADVVGSLSPRDRRGVRVRARQLVRALRWMFGTDVDREQDFEGLLRGMGVIERMRQADDRLREFPLTLDLLDAVARALAGSQVGDSGVLEGGDAQLVGLKPKYPDLAPKQYRAYLEREKALADRKLVMREVLDWAVSQEAAGPLRALGDHPDLDAGFEQVRVLIAWFARESDKVISHVLRLPDGAVVGEAERSAAFWALVPAYRWAKALTGSERGDAAAQILHRPELKGKADLDNSTGRNFLLTVAQAVAAGRDLRNLTELAAFHLVALGAYDEKTEVREAGSGKPTGRRYARGTERLEGFVPHSYIMAVQTADGREEYAEKPAEWHQDGKMSPHVLVLEQMAPDKVVLSLPGRAGIVVPHEEIAELQVHDPLLQKPELKAKDILLAATHSPARPGPLRPLVTSIVRSAGRPVWSTTALMKVRVSQQTFMLAVFPVGTPSGDLWSRVVPKDLVGSASSVATGGQVVSAGQGAGSRSSAGAVGQVVHTFSPSYGDGSSSDSGGEYQDLLAEVYQSGVAGLPSDVEVVLRWLDGLRRAEVDPRLHEGPFDLDALARRVLLPFDGVPDDVLVGPRQRVRFIALARRAMAGHMAEGGGQWEGGLARLAAFHLSEQGVFDDKYLISSGSGATTSYGRNWTLKGLDPQLDVTKLKGVAIRPDGTRVETPVRDAAWKRLGVLPYLLVAEPGDNRGPLVPLGGVARRVLWDVAAELIAMDPLLHQMDARAPQGEQVPMVFAWSRSGAGYLDVPRRAASRGKRLVYVVSAELEVGSFLWTVIRPDRPAVRWWPVSPGLEPQRYPDEPEWARNAVTHTVLSDRVGRADFSDVEYTGSRQHWMEGMPRKQTRVVLFVNPATGKVVRYVGLDVEWAYARYLHGLPRRAFIPQQDGGKAQIRPRELGLHIRRRPSLQQLAKEVTQESDGDRELISSCWAGCVGGEDDEPHDGARSPFVADLLAEVSMVQEVAYWTRRMTDGMPRSSGRTKKVDGELSDFVLSDVEWKEPLVLRMARPEPLPEELDDVAVRAGLVPADVAASLSPQDWDDVRGRALRLVRALRWMFGTDVDREQDFEGLLRGMGVIERMRQADDRLREFPLTLGLLDVVARALPDSPVEDSGVLEGGDAQLVGLEPMDPDEAPEHYRAYLEREKALEDRKPVMRDVLHWAVSQETAGPLGALGEHPDLHEGLRWVRDMGASLRGNPKLVAEVLRLVDGAVVGKADRSAALWALVPAYRWFEALPDRVRADAAARILHRPELQGTGGLDDATGWELGVAVAQAVAAGRDLRNLTELAAFHLVALGAYDEKTEVREAGSGMATGRRYVRGAERLERFVPDSYIMAVQTVDGDEGTRVRAEWNQDGKWSPHVLVLEEMAPDKVVLSLPGRAGIVVPHEEIAELQVHDPLLRYAELEAKDILLIDTTSPARPGPLRPLVTSIVRSAGRTVWSTTAHTKLRMIQQTFMLAVYPEGRSPADIWSRVVPKDLVGSASSVAPGGLFVSAGPGAGSRSSAGAGGQVVQAPSPSYGEGSSSDPWWVYQDLLSELYESAVAGLPSDVEVVLRWLGALRMAEVDEALRGGSFDLDVLARRVLLPFYGVPDDMLVSPEQRVEFIQLARRAMAGHLAAGGGAWEGGLARLAAFHLAEQGAFDDRYLIRAPSGQGEAYGRNWSPRNLDPQLDVTKVQPVLVGPDGTRTEGQVVDFDWDSPGVVPYVLVAEPGDNQGPMVPLGDVLGQVPWDVAAELIAMDPLLGQMDARAPQGERVRMVFAWSGSGAGYLDVPRRVASRGKRSVYATTGELEVGRVLRTLIRPDVPMNQWLPVGPGLEPKRYPDDQEWARNAATHTVFNNRSGRADFSDADYAGVRETTYNALPRKQTAVVLFMNPATGEIVEYVGLDVEWDYTWYGHGQPSQGFIPQQDGGLAEVPPHELGLHMKRRPSLQELAKEVTKDSDGGRTLAFVCWAGSAGPAGQRHRGARSPFAANPLVAESLVQGVAYRTRRMTDGYTRVVTAYGTEQRLREYVISDVEWKEPLVLRMARPDPLPGELDGVAVRAGLVPAYVVASLSSQELGGVRGRALRLVRALRWMFGTDVDREQEFGHLLRGMGVIERMRQADDRLREFPLTLDLLDAVARALPDSPVADSGVLEGGDAQLVGLRPKYPDKAREQFDRYVKRQKALGDREPVMRGVLDWAVSQETAGPLRALGDHPDLHEGLKWVREMGARLRGNPKRVADVLRLADGVVVGEAERSDALWALVPAYRWFMELAGSDRGDAAARILHRPELRGTADLDDATGWELGLTVAQALAAGRDLRNLTELAAFHLVSLGAYDKETEVRDAGSGEATGRRYVRGAQRLESFVWRSSMDAVRAADGREHLTEKRAEWHQDGKMSPHVLVLEQMAPHEVVLSLPGRDGIDVPHEEIAELQVHDPLLRKPKLEAKDILLVAAHSPARPGPLRPLVTSIVRSAGRPVWSTTAHTELRVSQQTFMLFVYPEGRSSGDVWSGVVPKDLVGSASSVAPGGQVVSAVPGAGSRSSAGAVGQVVNAFGPSYGEGSSSGSGGEYQDLLAELHRSGVAGLPSDAVVVLRWLDALRMAEVDGALRRGSFDLDALARRVLLPFDGVPDDVLVGPQQRVEFIQLAWRAMIGHLAAGGGEWQGGLARLAAFHLSEQGVFDDKYLISSGSGATMSYGRNWSLKDLDPDLDVTKLQPVAIRPDGTRIAAPMRDTLWKGLGVVPYLLVAELGDNRGPLVPLGGVARRVLWDVAAELIAMDPLLGQMDARAPQGEQVPMVFAWSRSGAGYLDVPRRAASRGKRSVYVTNSELEVGSVLRNLIRPDRPAARWWPVGPGLEPKRYPDDPEWARNAETHTVPDGRSGRADFPDADYAGLREEVIRALPRKQTAVVHYINPATGEIVPHRGLDVEWAYAWHLHGLPRRGRIPQQDGGAVRVSPHEMGLHIRRRPSLQQLAKEVTQESDGDRELICSCWAGCVGGEDDEPHFGARSPFVANPLTEVSTVQEVAYLTRRMTDGMPRSGGAYPYDDDELSDFQWSDVEWKEPLALRMARPDPLPEEMDSVAARAGLVPAGEIASLSSQDRRGVRGRALRLVRALRWMFGTDVDREQDFEGLLRGIGVIERMRQADDRLREFPLTLDLLDAVARALPGSPVADSGVLEGGDAQLVGLEPMYPDEAPELYRAYVKRQKALADRKRVMREVLRWARSQEAAGPLPALTDCPGLRNGLAPLRDLSAWFGRHSDWIIPRVLYLEDGATVGEAERSDALWALVPAVRWFDTLAGSDRADAAAQILHRPELRGTADLDDATAQHLSLTVAQAVAAGRDLRNRTELAAFHLVALGAYDKKTEIRNANSGKATGRRYARGAERVRKVVPQSYMMAVQTADGGEEGTRVQAEWHQDGKRSPHVLVLEEMAADKVVLSLPGRAGIVVPHEEIAELQVHDPLLREPKLKAKDILLVALNPASRPGPLRPLVTSIVRSAGRTVWSTTARTELFQTSPRTYSLVVHPDGRSPGDLWSAVKPRELVGNASSAGAAPAVTAGSDGMAHDLQAPARNAVEGSLPSDGSGDSAEPDGARPPGAGPTPVRVPAQGHGPVPGPAVPGPAVPARGPAGAPGPAVGGLNLDLVPRGHAAPERG